MRAGGRHFTSLRCRACRPLDLTHDSFDFLPLAFTRMVDPLSRRPGSTGSLGHTTARVPGVGDGMSCAPMGDVGSPRLVESGGEPSGFERRPGGRLADRDTGLTG